MMMLIGLLVGLAQAAPSLLTKPMEKSESQSALLAYQKALKSQKNITIRSAKFFVSGKGYKQRVVIEGFRNNIEASAIVSKLKPELQSLSLLTSDGRQLAYHPHSGVFGPKKAMASPSSLSAKGDKTSTAVVPNSTSKNVNDSPIVQEEQSKLIRIVPESTQNGKATDAYVKPVEGSVVKKSMPTAAGSGGKLKESTSIKVEISSPKTSVMSTRQPLLKPTATDVLSMAKVPLEKLSSIWSASSTETMNFTRVLFDPSLKSALKANHLFVRDGDAMRLEVQVVDGVGQNSTTVLSPDGKSWIVVGDRAVKKSGNRTREILKQFSSKSLLAILLNFSTDIETDGQWGGLTIAKKSTTGWRLSRDPTNKRVGVIQAEFDPNGWLLRELLLKQNDGDWRYVFSNYKSVGGVVDVLVPHQMTISKNDKVIEEITIQDIALNRTIDKKRFTK